MTHEQVIDELEHHIECNDFHIEQAKLEKMPASERKLQIEIYEHENEAFQIAIDSLKRPEMPTLNEVLKSLSETRDTHWLLSTYLKLTADAVDEAAKNAPAPEEGHVPIVTIGADSTALREAAEELVSLRQVCAMLLERFNMPTGDIAA